VLNPPSSPTEPAPRWLGPVRLPADFAGRLLRAATSLADRIGPWYCWPLVGVLVGALPLAVDVVFGWSQSRLTTALLLTPLLVAAAARGTPGRGMAVLVAAIVVHSLGFIALAAHAPDRLSGSFPAGEDYWRRSHAWITTGESDEYNPASWVPDHVLHLVAVVVFGYLSLGLVPLWEGFYEVDLMNVYVGRLLAHSTSPGPALLLGWHPWSVCRGIGFLLLTYQVASWSLSRLTGAPSDGGATRRWVIGLSFLVLDGILKYACLEDVRCVLAANLR
jgi:hypothetical protein